MQYWQMMELVSTPQGFPYWEDGGGYPTGKKFTHHPQ